MMFTKMYGKWVHAEYSVFETTNVNSMGMPQHIIILRHLPSGQETIFENQTLEQVVLDFNRRQESLYKEG